MGRSQRSSGRVCSRGGGGGSRTQPQLPEAPRKAPKVDKQWPAASAFSSHRVTPGEGVVRRGEGMTEVALGSPRQNAPESGHRDSEEDEEANERSPTPPTPTPTATAPWSRAWVSRYAARRQLGGARGG